LKKRRLLLLILGGVLVGGFLLSSPVLARYGTSGLCNPQDTGSLGSPTTPNDRDYFPYGFLCGGDKDDTSSIDFKIFNGATDITPSGSTGSLAINSKITIKGKYNQSGIPKGAGGAGPAEVLVWMTVDGAGSLIADATIPSFSSGGSKSTDCPGTSGSRPGVVYNFRDLSSGGANTNYNNSGGNGTDASPAAYNPNNGEGKEDCGASGKMVHWKNATSGTTRSFELQLNKNRTGNLCVRMNISVRFNGGQPYFPPSGITSPPTNLSEQSSQSSVARHIAKQSERRCFDVVAPTSTNKPPVGKIATILCNGQYSLKGISDPNYSGAISYRLRPAGSSTTTPGGAGSSTGTASGTLSGTVQGIKFELVLRDHNLPLGSVGSWVIVDYFTVPKCNKPANLSMTISCGGIELGSIFDGDSAPGVAIIVKFWHRFDDGSGFETWTPVNGNPDYNPANPATWDQYYDDQNGSLSIQWPWYAEDGNNQGWGVWVGAFDAGAGGADSNPKWYYSGELEGACYQAECTLNVVESKDNNGNDFPTDGVKANEPFDVDVTFYNNPKNNTVPATMWWTPDNPWYPSGVYTYAGTTDSPTNPLGGEFWGTGAILSGTVTSPDFGSGPRDFPESGAIIQGYPQTGRMSFNAPNDVNVRTLSMYPDYWGRLPIGPECATPVRTYQPFDMSVGATTTLLPDDESPRRVEFGTTVKKQFGPNVQVKTTRSHTLQRAGGPKSPLAPVLFYQPNPDTQVYGGDRNYKEEHDIYGTPKLGDDYCILSTIDRGSGWVGPGGPDDVANNGPKSDDDCAMVANHPYVRAYGADVAAGGGFPGSCGVITNAGIKAYARPLAEHNTLADRSGSGAQLAAMALDQISGFTTATTRTADPFQPRTYMGLTYANTDPASDVSSFRAKLGGYMTGDGWCMPDYWKTQYPDGSDRKVDVSTSPAAVSVGSFADLQQTVRSIDGGILQLNGTTNFNKRHTLYVDGDVYINGNITYSTNYTAGASAIPSFTLVARGNIYIDKDVTQLDGFYIAQPIDRTGGSRDGQGRVYTCTDAANISDIQSDSTAVYMYMYNNCGAGNGYVPPRQLTVNGAVVAQKVMLTRTGFSLRDSRFQEQAGVSKAAEIFNFPLEMYLSPPFFSPRSTATSGEYDYISILPPIL
jgi:hypothetical protein